MSSVTLQNQTHSHEKTKTTTHTFSAFALDSDDKLLSLDVGLVTDMLLVLRGLVFLSLTRVRCHIRRRVQWYMDGVPWLSPRSWFRTSFQKSMPYDHPSVSVEGGST
jgi:hypothetical protein